MVADSLTQGGVMKYFARLMVFVMSVFVPASMFAFVSAGFCTLPGKEVFIPVWFCIGGFVGFMFSGRAMDSVAGKLLPDEQ